MVGYVVMPLMIVLNKYDCPELRALSQEIMFTNNKMTGNLHVFNIVYVATTSGGSPTWMIESVKSCINKAFSKGSKMVGQTYYGPGVETLSVCF